MRTETDTPTTPAAARTPPPTDRSPVSPSRQSMALAALWGSDMVKGGPDAVDAGLLFADARARLAAVHGGDMRPIEAALLGQAEMLGAAFMSLQNRARNSADIERFRILLTLAMKAQAQSRAAYEAIAEIRNPRQVLIAKQANIAQQQMVSNGGARDGAQKPARTGTTTSAPIELLEESHGHNLDTSAARAPVGADARAATVGAVDRTPDARGQGRRVKERVQRRMAATDA